MIDQLQKIVREHYFGHGYYVYWFVILEHEIRQGEKSDKLYFHQFNYVDDEYLNQEKIT